MDKKSHLESNVAHSTTADTFIHCDDILDRIINTYARG